MTVQLKSINEAIMNLNDYVLFVYQYSLAEKNEANYIKHVTLEELVEKFEVTLDEKLERMDSNVNYFKDQPHEDRPERQFVNEVNQFSYEFLRDKNVRHMLHFETSFDVIDLYVIER
ncbi:hypothetical protein D3C80_670770 [compost metagenome]